mmetsp:Transcript_117238/g.207311  ORF Transcript_117238/g.207311 Transcript_117238/m.207311 type:complete len:299 (+) Transcript_117238:1033-1929(+)
MSSPLRSFPKSIMTSADGLFEDLRCFSIFSMSSSLLFRFASTSASLCVDVSSSLYFLASSWTSLSGFGLPTNVPFCISLSFTISKPGGDRAVSMISYKANRSPSHVSGRLFNSSFNMRAMRPSMVKRSQNSWTSGSIGVVDAAAVPVAAVVAAAPAAGTGGAMELMAAVGPLFITESTICLATAILSAEPLIVIFRGMPSGTFWSIWMEHPERCCKSRIVSPPLPITRPTSSFGQSSKIDCNGLAAGAATGGRPGNPIPGSPGASPGSCNPGGNPSCGKPGGNPSCGKPGKPCACSWL